MSESTTGTAGATVAAGPADSADTVEAEQAAGSSSGLDVEDREALLIREGDIAGDYLEQLLDILDVDGDLDMDVQGDRAVVDIVGSGLNKLIGQDGATLDALQELTRLTVLGQTGVRSRLMLDIGGHRARRRSQLQQRAEEAVGRALQSQAEQRMAAMNAFERKVVHDVVSDSDGVQSSSEGAEPNRYVVIRPDDAGASTD